MGTTEEGEHGSTQRPCCPWTPQAEGISSLRQWSWAGHEFLLYQDYMDRPGHYVAHIHLPGGGLPISLVCETDVPCHLMGLDDLLDSLRRKAARKARSGGRPGRALGHVADLARQRRIEACLRDDG